MGRVADGEQPINEALLVGGLEQRDIVVVAYDSSWPARYDAHRRRIQAALGASARRVEHIGSTAVPGLLAKPIIDVMLIVDNVEYEAGYRAPLMAVGYVLRVREPGHRMMRTPDLAVHVHIWSDGAPAIERHLAFRDQLRASREDRDRYAAMKLELAGRNWPTMNHYAAAKTEVIRQILDRSSSHGTSRPN